MSVLMVMFIFVNFLTINSLRSSIEVEDSAFPVLESSKGFWRNMFKTLEILS